MATTKLQSTNPWALARLQHGVITRWQLIEQGFSPAAIRHRISTGRLHPVARGVYAVGRPELSRHGRWMAAVLTCGSHAALIHESAATLWGIRDRERRGVEVAVPGDARRRRTGIQIHRRSLTANDFTTHHNIPVTTPICTLIDLAARLTPSETERAVNDADKLDLVDPEALRDALDETDPRPGIRPLRGLLDYRTFTMTDSMNEQRFLPIARKAGLPKPETQQWVNGFRVDFFWPELKLIVETDGLRYHRTAAQQAEDHLRDQAHAIADFTPLRFTRAQVRFEPDHVQRVLAAVAARLYSRRSDRLAS
jgi:very-short-patch-repair endonuclease